MALRVWLPLNGNLNNQGLSNITPINHDCTIGEGKIGNCYVFNGSTSYIDMGDSFSDIIKGYGQPFSIAFWLKSLEDGTRGVLFSTFPNTGNLNFLSLEENAGGVTTNALRFDWKQDYDVYVHNFFDLGKWVHATITYDGNQTISFYKNGELKDTKTKQLGIIENPPKNFWLGNDVRLGATSLNGSMNDFRLYDECLTPKQVKEISKGLVAHYKLTGVGANPNLAKNTNTDSLSTNAAYYHEATGGHARSLEYDENGVPCICFVRNDTAHSGWQYLSYDNFDRTAITTNTTYTVSVDIKASVDGSLSLTGLLNGNATNYMTNSSTTINGTILANKWNHLVFTCTTISDFSSITVGSQVIYWSMSNSLLGTGVSLWIKNVKLEEGSVETDYIPNVNDTKYSSLGYENNICTDVSGYGHTATKSGTLVFNSDSPRYEGGIKFDSGYLHKIPSPLNASSDAFTISCWFNPRVSGTQAIINDRKSVGDGLSVFYYSGTQMRFDTGSSYQWVVSASDFGLNKWNFLTFVWDKNEGTKKYYLNGNLSGSTTSYGTIANIGEVYSIGNSSTNGAAGAGNQVYGSISDFRIYSTALSDEDIKELYQTSAMVDNQGNSYAYEFKEE